MSDHNYQSLMSKSYTDDNHNDMVGKLFDYIPKAFSVDECNLINQMFDGYDESLGLVGEYNQQGVMEYSQMLHLRDCHVTYTGKTPENQWIHDRVENLIQSANQKFWKCDIVDFSQPMRRMKYGPSEHFNSWHPDFGIGDNCFRKLTCVTMLDDNSTFTGGDFQIAAYGTIPLFQGDAIVFPTYIYHRVTPVLSGLRRSLVHRAIGPHFK